jgi:hypothetical protein
MHDLDAKLGECEQLLRTHHVYDWANRIEDLRSSGLSSSERASQVLSWFGGMGSLNDRFICPENHDHITAREVPSVNAKLKELVEELYALAAR